MLEKENDRLKKLVADLALDNVILKDAAKGKKITTGEGVWVHRVLKIVFFIYYQRKDDEARYEK